MSIGRDVKFYQFLPFQDLFKPPEEEAIGSKACERKYKSPLATKCPPSCIMKIEIHELLTAAQMKIIKVDSGD